jgi:preprotein translocase subunit SecG
MVTVITAIHVVVCVFLVLVVLLQTGKGADMGAVFGGSSSTVFGSSGAGNFLTRLTTGAAIVFMLTSLGLTYLSGRQTASTVFDAAPQEEPAPQADLPPAGAPAPMAQQPAPPAEAPAAQSAEAPPAPAAPAQAPQPPAEQAAE